MKNDKLTLKGSIKQLKDELKQRFFQNTNIITLTHHLVTEIDAILQALFYKYALDKKNKFCLLALGSYGRRELQLHSDIDILLLHDEIVDIFSLQRAQLFVQDCWDIGLELSHQITTVKDCAELASQDLTVISSILDTRLLCGKSNLMEELLYQTHSLHMWTSHDYFFAKQNEQKIRYAKYGETAYNLEPNVKNGVGGLRDLQVLLHISKRHFGIKKLADGTTFNFLTDKELEELNHCLHFLWRVRFALHILAQKKEERLLFDYQIKLAKLFGYQDNPHSLAIEQFMKAYFKIIKRSRELNEMLLQWFAETIAYNQKQILQPLDNCFQLSNQYIEARHPRIFIKKPLALIELFLWLAKNPQIKGVRANTIRLIRQHLYLIDKRFSRAKAATTLFIEIFKADRGPYEVLQRMSRYGVLGHYLHCFAAATGQMQYDLFHVFTVDQHTLFVIRNLGRFLNSRYKEQFPLGHNLMATLSRREILYLAALFHDIAKGRGGDHSELGALEAEQFAIQHHLSLEDSQLLTWLVKNHLLMSHTAQRQDIYDPKTIQQFCSYFPQDYYLDYLYLLTVADICGTNPTLWNAWKDSLLKELYYASKEALKQEKIIVDEAALIELKRNQAFKILMEKQASSEAIWDLWINFKGRYFLHESPEVIATHTLAILESKTFPLVLILPHYTLGGTEVFIYTPHIDERFTITTTILSNHHVTIQEATILTCDNGFDLDTYIILDEKNQAVVNKNQIALIQEALTFHLKPHVLLPTISRRRLSRAQAHFKIKPQIIYAEDHKNQHTQLFLVTADKPGLLAHISRIFLQEEVHLHNAKIATAGERVEDMFYLSSQGGKLLTPEKQEKLRKKLLNELYP